MEQKLRQKRTPERAEGIDLPTCLRILSWRPAVVNSRSLSRGAPGVARARILAAGPKLGKLAGRAISLVRRDVLLGGPDVSRVLPERVWIRAELLTLRPVSVWRRRPSFLANAIRATCHNSTIGRKLPVWSEGHRAGRAGIRLI